MTETQSSFTPEELARFDDAKRIAEIQGTVNLVQGGPDWVTRTRFGSMDQCMAMFDELVEYSKSMIRFRWWGGEEDATDVSNAKVELVDVLHFLLSYELAQENSTSTTVAANLAAAYDVCLTQENEGVTQTFKNFTASVLMGDPDLVDFFHLCRLTGMSWDHLVLYYLGKSTLNKFRNANGYSDKPRTYLKKWFDGKQEDNYYLMLFIDESIANGVKLDVDQIQVWLEHQYAAVKQSRSV